MSVKKLVRELLSQDLDNQGFKDSPPIATDGRKAYARWLAASKDAGDRELREEMEDIDPADFAREWERQAAELEPESDTESGV